METHRGKLLGRYEIVAEIGRGAMGAVYQARDPRIDRFVAIKTILLHQSGLREQEEFRQRFLVEAKAAGRLLHPGIVTVFDVGEEPGTSDPYIVMEYIEGRTLRDLLAGETKRLPLERALEITIEIAEALDYAHAQGVVHRDIKPANILITKEGQAKIGDFGIAQLDLSHITLPGYAVGTPAYMSPEQVEGERLDGRSDLFSLGAILYSMLTGFSPFQGNSATTVCFKVMNRNPLQVTTLAPELPAQLDAVIVRALAKDRTHRYQRGMELARDLKELRERAADHAKGKLWFSAPDGRKRFLDGTAKLPVVRANAKGSNASNSPAPATGKARGVFSLFSFSPLQVGVAALTLLLASIALGLLAWQEIRRPKPSPIAIADSVSTPRRPLPAPVVSPAATESKSDAQTEHAAAIENQPEPTASDIPAAPDSGALSKTPVTATPKPGTHTTPKAAKVTGAKDGLLSPSKNGGPAASPSGTKASAVPAVVKNAPSPGSVATEVPQLSPAVANSDLAIHVEHHFSDATLSIWIDGHLAYEHPLHDGHKKRLLLLGGGVRQSLTIPLAAGKHTLRVQVRSAAEQYDQSKNVDGEFLKGGEKTLSINFDKHTQEMRVALGNEAGPTPKLEPAQ